MISNPRPGQLVRISYAASKRSATDLHGKIGRVVIPCRARRARNHGVEIDGRMVVIPAGQLQPISTGEDGK
jgi:hypothetical protein